MAKILVFPLPSCTLTSNKCHKDSWIGIFELLFTMLLLFLIEGSDQVLLSSFGVPRPWKRKFVFVFLFVFGFYLCLGLCTKRQGNFARDLRPLPLAQATNHSNNATTGR